MSPVPAAPPETLGVPVSPTSPPGSSTPSPPRTAPLPGSRTPSPTMNGQPVFSAASGPLDDPIDTAPNLPSGTRSSGPDDVALQLPDKPIEEILRGLVVVGGEGAHHALARHPIEQEAGIWLIEGEKEAATIADPLARIATKYTGPLVNPMIANLLEAGVALGAYVIKNATKAFMVRRALRKMQNVQPGFIPTAQGDSQ